MIKLNESEQNRIKQIIYGNLDRLFKTLDDLNGNDNKKETKEE